MKTLLLLTTAAASFSLAACTEDRPRVVHETRVVHHYHHSSDQVNVPTGDSPENFQANERPATYSH